MTIALAKHLVATGVISAAVMDDALQRQVLFGGSIGTNLMEMGQIDESALTVALSEVHHLPVAPPDLLTHWDPRMLKLFPPRLAQKYQVVPVTVSGRSVIVLAAARPHPLMVDEIGFMLSLSMKIHMVCEARLQILYRDWLGIEIDSRFGVLGDFLGGYQVSPPAAVSPPPLVMAEQKLEVPPGEEAAVVDPTKVKQVLDTVEVADRLENAKREKARSGRISLSKATEACMLAEHRDELVDIILRFSRQFVPFVGLFVVSNKAILGWDAVGAEGARVRIRKVRIPLSAPSVLKTVLETRAHYLGMLPDSGINEELLQTLGRSKPRNVLIVPLLLKERPIGLLYGDGGSKAVRGERLMELLVFMSRLSGAFEQLILRKKAEEKAPSLVESAAFAEEPPPVELPVDLGNKENDWSEFNQEVQTDFKEKNQPPETAKEEHREEAKEEPVLVEEEIFEARQRLPAIDPEQLGIPKMPSFFNASDQRVREEPVQVLPLDQKEEGTINVVDGETEVVVLDASSDFAPVSETKEKEWVAPQEPLPQKTRDEPAEGLSLESPPEPVQESEGSEDEAKTLIVARPGLSPDLFVQADLNDLNRMERLADELVGGITGVMTRACEQLCAIGPAAIPSVFKRFPGKLSFDVRSSHDTVPPLAEHGELIRCLLELGEGVVAPLLGRIEDADPRVRYYVVKCLGELRQPKVVPFLAGRLYDREAFVRLAAIDALQLYRKTPEYDAMLAGLRSRLKDDDFDQQAIAAALLGNFKDREALLPLMGLLNSHSKMVCRVAQESLSYITKQDLGTGEKKWIQWWKIHKGEPRVQWLIEGLRSKNRDIRFSSAQELGQLTSQYFDYYFDAEKKEREKAIDQWEEWWQEKGRGMRLED
jgi:hypothetical protein